MDKSDATTSIEKEVIDIVVEQLGIDAADVTVEKAFVEGLNADSLDLTELIMTAAHAKNLNVSVKEWNEKVIFLHKIVEGAADKSYGIHVADIAGIPGEVVERAGEILENLELGSINDNNLPRLAERKDHKAEPVQLSIFDVKNEKVLKKLKEIDINALTPIEALTILNSLHKDVE